MDGSTDRGEGLAALESRLRRDLACLGFPAANWVPPRPGVADVVIVGAGMCGLVAWIAMMTSGIRNLRIIDGSPAGFEGPWLTYARMETLRSPKHLTGPAFGLGALTFQAWYRAQRGDAAWDRLDKIPRPQWMDYLRWVRSVLAVPVENGVSLERVAPEDDLLRLSTSGGDILARKVVYATGREGTGYATLPGFVEGLPKRLWAHSSEDIDFPALKGRRVAVIGVGASAVDNAAEALEAGAAEVRHLIRRDHMPTINKMMGIGSPGFVAGYARLTDAWRWRFMNYSFVTQTPPPKGSTLRVSRHPNAHFHFSKATTEIEPHQQGARIAFADGTRLDTDFVILGTGFTTDPMARTELGAAAADILLWRDVYDPPAGEANPDLARFPYLAPDFSFRPRVPGTSDWLGRLFCFNYGATVSLGKVSGDIPGVSDGARWLADGIAARLYAEDVERHWRNMLAYSKPELGGEEWRADPLPTDITETVR